MGSYLSHTPAQEEEMLREAGYRDYDQLFEEVPEAVRLRRPLNIPAGGSEWEVRRKVEAMAAENTVFPHVFRGAGAYRHYIPAIVRQVTAKEEFLTAYTPYQAEISQGNLQAIFEYQTMICELTGMEAANASVYDGATAAAEAVFMCRERKRLDVLVSAAVDPQTAGTVGTYCHGRDARVETVPARDGVTDLEALRGLLGEGTACLLVQQPNYWGNLEDLPALCAAAHEAGAKVIVSVNPIALGLLETPGEAGADIAVGEGQPLGMPLSFGGPYLGFMACTKAMMRKLPGRIVGQTTDHQGRRGFVLTLQAREQHIRREKASSNICSNEALCALTASVYLSAMGPGGLARAAELCCSKAHYLRKVLEEAGLAPVYDREFFHEFVTRCPVEPEKLLSALGEKGYLGGLPLPDGTLLWCATEMNTKEEMDGLAALVKEVLGK